MRRNRGPALLVNVSVLGAVMLYFLFPHQRYVATFAVLAIGTGFLIRHVRRHNLRGAVICGAGLFLVVLLLPNVAIIKESEAFLVGLALVVGAIFANRIKGPTS